MDSEWIKDIRQFILAFGMVFDTPENHRKCEQKSNDEQNPGRQEDVHESNILQLNLKSQRIRKSGLTGVLRHLHATCLQLQPIEETCLSIINLSSSVICIAWLTKTAVVCKLCRVIWHGAHDPVWGSLPNCIENTTQDVEKHPPNILPFVYIYPMLVLCQCFTSVSPAVRSATRLVGSQKNTDLW